MYYKQKYIESIETLKSNINGLSSDEAKKRLNNVGARLLGVVANKLETHENGYYHYNYE